MAPWTSNLRIFFISKTDLVVHDERNRMAFTPSKSALRFSRSQGGGGESPPPPHQLTSSRTPTSNRVKKYNSLHAEAQQHLSQTCKRLWFESWIESASNDLCLNHESNRITFFITAWITRWINSFFEKPDWIISWVESIPKRCWVKSIDQTIILWRLTLVHTAIKPNPDHMYIGIGIGICRPVNYWFEPWESWIESESNDFCLIHESNRSAYSKVT